MPWFYYVTKAMIRALLFLFTRWRVQGKENILRQGPLLIVANHLNLADPALLGVSIDRKMIFMAKEELFRSRFSSYLLRNLGTFPVRRGIPDRKAFNQAEYWLTQGMALVMFPEGRRSQDARLQSGFPGSARIASRIGVPILPVGISGTERIKGKIWWFRRPKITVNIGHPFCLPAASSKLTRVELARLANSVMARIAELLPTEYRGNYTEGKITNHEN